MNRNDFGCLRLELPFAMEAITRLEIQAEAGEHVRAVLLGIGAECDLQACMETGMDQRIRIYAKEQDQETLLFSGIPTVVRVCRRDQLEVEMEAASYSILLDLKKKSRSFQRKEMKYSELFSEILRDSNGEALIREQREDGIKAPFVQYEETDWEFLKRLSSCYGSPLYAWELGEKPQVSIGVGEGEIIKSVPRLLGLEKQLEESLRFRQKSGSLEPPFFSPLVRCGEPFSIGDQVSSRGERFRIGTKRIFLEHGRLVYESRLMPEKAVEIPEKRNGALKGIGIQGTILKAEANRVKLHLEIDRRQEEEDGFWYPFYRTDWYCMPETGSRAFLYFPTDDEAQAYVCAIRRTDGEENEKAGNPREKYMGSQEGKELKLTPEGVSVHAAAHEVFMELTEQGGVRVKSKKGLILGSGKRFRCSGKTITVESRERIRLRTEQTALSMDDLIQLKG